MRILTALSLLILLASPAFARDQFRELWRNFPVQRPVPQPRPQPTPQPTPQPLSAPIPLTASTLSNRVTLKWSNVAQETGYLVERRTQGGENFSEVGKTIADSTTYTDILTSTNRYEYRVRAYKIGAGSLAYSPYTEVAYSTSSCE